MLLHFASTAGTSTDDRDCTIIVLVVVAVAVELPTAMHMSVQSDAFSKPFSDHTVFTPSVASPRMIVVPSAHVPEGGWCLGYLYLGLSREHALLMTLLLSISQSEYKSQDLACMREFIQSKAIKTTNFTGATTNPR